MGTTRFASISTEGEDDVAELREMGLVERLKLATSHHIYVSAYRITLAGKDTVKDIEKEHHSAVDELLLCKKCGNTVDIEARPDAPYMVCKECGEEVKIAIFEIDEIPYVSKPHFIKIWLPPD
jgi:translation initiation factor 2 beta subunit (eIF-2beta)/eIF-5